MKGETPESVAEWMIRARGRRPVSAARRQRLAIAQAHGFITGFTTRGKEFWWSVMHLLTHRRIGTKCAHGHEFTVNTCYAAQNTDGRVVIVCSLCRRDDAAKRREEMLAYCRAYYQRNRERLSTKARERARKIAARTLNTRNQPLNMSASKSSDAVDLVGPVTHEGT